MFVYPEGPLFLVWATDQRLIKPFMDTAAFITTLTCVGVTLSTLFQVHIGPWSLYRSEEYGDLFETQCSEQHRLFFLFFFLHLLVAVLLYKNMHSYPCQPTYTVYIRTLIYVHSVLYLPSCCAVKQKREKKNYTQQTHCFFLNFTKTGKANMTHVRGRAKSAR